MWQERVHIVAMVTNTVERGQQKCEQYCPDEGTKEYGPFKVTLADKQVFADYTIRQLFVSVSLMILHYTFSTLIHSSAKHFFYMGNTIRYSCFPIAISLPFITGSVIRKRAVCDKLKIDTFDKVLNVHRGTYESETPLIFIAVHYYICENSDSQKFSTIRYVYAKQVIGRYTVVFEDFVEIILQIRCRKPCGRHTRNVVWTWHASKFYTLSHLSVLKLAAVSKAMPTSKVSFWRASLADSATCCLSTLLHMKTVVYV